MALHAALAGFLNFGICRYAYLPENKNLFRPLAKVSPLNILPLPPQTWIARVVLIALICVALAGPAAWAQKAGKSKDARGGAIEMNFKNVDLVNFLSAMSATLGMAFVWDEKDIKGKITLVSPRKFKRDDAFRIFETVLALHGYTTIRKKGSPVIQVVPLKDAPRIPSPTRTDIDERRTGNVLVTQIIPLKFADANLVKAAVTSIISKSAALAVYAPANVILLTDTEANIARILTVIKEFDIAPGDIEFKVIKLQFASAKRLEPILTSLLVKRAGGRRVTPAKGRAARAARAGAAGGGAKVVAEDHTNSLIIVADPFTVAQMERLIETLDVPGAVPDSGIKVYRLQHADAEEMAKILKDVKQKIGKKGSAATRSGAKVSISADKATNSLIVFGPPDVIQRTDEMVRALDVRRPQVFVEALIMEITLEKSLQLGVRWQGTVQAGDAAIGFGNPNATPQTLAETLAGGSGAVVGVIGNEITFQGQKFASFSAFIQATRQDQDLNILANPQILTLNNEEAVINVSQVVPISSKILRDANQNTTTEFEFKDIGIILKITPQITGNNKVRLIIDQESSAVAAKQSGVTDQQAITTLKRSLKTKVLVDNNSTIAIGGLIQDQQVVTVTKVPCLGDIPVLGWFFKSRSEELRKTNLIVFIRPRIITTRDELESISRDVKDRFDDTRGLKGDTEDVLRQDLDIMAEPGREYDVDQGPPPGEAGKPGAQ
jgi:general secretion pathway protein D